MGGAWRWRPHPLGVTPAADQAVRGRGENGQNLGDTFRDLTQNGRRTDTMTLGAAFLRTCLERRASTSFWPCTPKTQSLKIRINDASWRKKRGWGVEAAFRRGFLPPHLLETRFKVLFLAQRDFISLFPDSPLLPPHFELFFLLSQSLPEKHPAFVF